jgi:4-amino-4-deoxy-L-arabinose transferase-like glycosyltransferase
MMNRFKIFIYVIVSIIFLSLFVLAIGLRFYRLSQNPPGFFCDEASNGFNAYMIWTRGTDEYGVCFPVFFRTFGEYRNPVVIYTLAPIVGLFGLSESTVRFTGAAYGLLSIIGMFLLTRQLLNKEVALYSVIFLSISPWHFHMSRIGEQMITSVFWVTIGFTFLELAKRSIKFFPLASVSLILGFLSYFPPRLYLIPLVGSYLLINRKNVIKWFNFRTFWISSMMSFAVFCILIYPNIVNGTFFARWRQVEHISGTKQILQSYINHFSFDFLFRRGDIDFPGQFITRHSISGVGQLYWMQLPLLIFGYLSIIRKQNVYRKSLAFLFVWTLLYPLGSIFTTLNPQATRSVIGVVPLSIVSAYGWTQLKLLFKQAQLPLLIIFGVLLSISFFWFINLWMRYPNYSADFWGWQYGPKMVMEYFLAHQDDYDQLCLEGKFNGPNIFINFYDPENICQGKCQVCDLNDYNPNKKQIFAFSQETYEIISQTQKSNEFKIKQNINYPNGKVAFILGSFAH